MSGNVWMFSHMIDDEDLKILQKDFIGDCLLVAVNSDQSIRRLKGKERPINTFQDRIEILECVSKSINPREI